MLYLTPGFTAFVLCVTAAFGLAVGSFLNCMAWRMTHGESVLKGRSHCAVCNHTLSPRDLVPLFSFLALKGRCRYCGTKISIRYPLAELVTACVFIAVVLRYGVSLLALRFLVFAVVLLTLSLVDLEEKIIPDSLLIAAAVWWLITLPFISGELLYDLGRGLVGGAGIALPMLLIVLAADKIMGRETMGGGDIKLFFVAGLYLGLPLNMMNMIVSCLIGIVFGLAGKTARQNDEDPAAIPFGPAIAGGSLFTLLFGRFILNWYLGFLY